MRRALVAIFAVVIVGCGGAREIRGLTHDEALTQARAAARELARWTARRCHEKPKPVTEVRCDAGRRGWLCRYSVSDGARGALVLPADSRGQAFTVLC